MYRIRYAFLAAGLLALSAPLAAQQVYLDPSLRPLLDPTWRAEARPPAGTIDEIHQLGSGITVQRVSPDAPPTVGVFVRLDEAMGLDELRAAGAEIGTVIGDIVTARVPLDAFERLVGARAIRSIEAARYVRVEHDSSMRAIGADQVRQVVGGEWQGATGSGAIVAIYDTGLDFRHADFRRTDGSTRVLGIWDQVGDPSPPTGFNYGFHCSQSAIQAAIGGQTALCPQRDIIGHGTHVAGSAAGNGSAGPTPFRYAGVAPEADLLIVKGGNGSFTEDRIVDGLSWLRQQGQALGRPVVANLSLGGQYGPHDGSRLYEQAIDALVGAGFIVVTSAGNEGQNFNTTPPPEFAPLIHARGNAVAGQATTFTFEISPYTVNTENLCNGNFALFSLWYGTQDSLRVTVTRPNGSAASARRGVITNDAQPTGGILIDNGSDGPVPGTNTLEAYIQVAGCGGGGAPAAGTWRITVQPDGPASGAPYDMWMWAVNMGQNGRVTGATGFDNRFVISSPGNAQRILTVGAFATRMCWESGGSQICYVAREAIGDIARFSGAGPTRDGRLKPEITAPGIAVVSSLSSNASIAAQRVVGQTHVALEGTSMASPHVAGAIALLFAERPDLTPEDVRDIFSRTARQDQFTARTYGNFPGGQPQHWWGFGKLDVPAALAAIADAPVARVEVSPARDTMPVGATLQLRIDAFGEEDQPVFARATWSSSDPSVATVDAHGLVRAVATGTAEIVAMVDGLSASATIVVQPPAVLIVESTSAAPDTVIRAPRGTRLPLLALTLAADGPEGIDLRQLGFEVTGDDPNARVRIYRDVAGDGQLDDDDVLIGDVQVALTPQPAQIDVPLSGVQIERGATVHAIMAIEVSGSAPNLAAYQARLLPARTRTIGLRSGALDRIEVPTAPVASGPVVTTLLAPGQLYSLSENPVRGGHLIINFREAPSRVELYSLAGGRVADLRTRLEGDTRLRWNLENDRNQRVAPGVYLLIVETGGETFRERLFILTPAVTAGQE